MSLASSSMDQQLSQLRESLEQLESFELPEKLASYLESSSTPSSSTSPNDKRMVGGLSDEVMQRYNRAKQEYWKLRVQQVFNESLGNFDGTGFGALRVDGEDVPLPTQEELDEVYRQRQEIQQTLLRTASETSQHLTSLQATHRTILSRREELARMIQEVQDGKDNSTTQDAEDEGDDDVEDNDLLYQEQKLEALRERRAQLEAQLAQMQDESNRKRLALRELELETEKLRTESPTSIVVTADPEELNEETKAIQSKVEEFKEMADYYDSMREIMEELCGMRILSVQECQDDEASILLQVELLRQHKIEIRLSERRRHRNDASLSVAHARFVTSRTLVSEVQADNGTVSKVQLDMPLLDDLVQLAYNLGPREDLRFLLRETKTRMYALTARVDELAKLRTIYLTQIGSMGDSGDQEIVCSLNEGVSVVLRLTPDCPLVKDSVSVTQLVGVGGWDVNVVQRWKDELNEQGFQSPLELMEALMKIVQQHQDGVPRTPSMPSRGAGRRNRADNDE